MRSITLSFLTILSVSMFPAHQAFSASSSMWYLWQQGEIADAARVARRSVQSDPDSAYHMLMLTAFVQGKFRQAIEHQKRISPSYSRFQETLMPVIDAYRHLGLYPQAHSFSVSQGVKSPEGLQETLKESASNPPVFHLPQTTEIGFKTDDPYNPYLPTFNMKVNTSLVGPLSMPLTLQEPPSLRFFSQSIN